MGGWGFRNGVRYMNIIYSELLPDTHARKNAVALNESCDGPLIFAGSIKYKWIIILWCVNCLVNRKARTWEYSSCERRPVIKSTAYIVGHRRRPVGTQAVSPVALVNMVLLYTSLAELLDQEVLAMRLESNLNVWCLFSGLYVCRQLDDVTATIPLSEPLERLFTFGRLYRHRPRRMTGVGLKALQ